MKTLYRCVLFVAEEVDCAALCWQWGRTTQKGNVEYAPSIMLRDAQSIMSVEQIFNAVTSAMAVTQELTVCSTVRILSHSNGKDQSIAKSIWKDIERVSKCQNFTVGRRWIRLPTKGLLRRLRRISWEHHPRWSTGLLGGSQQRLKNLEPWEVLWLPVASLVVVGGLCGACDPGDYHSPLLKVPGLASICCWGRSGTMLASFVR